MRQLSTVSGHPAGGAESEEKGGDQVGDGDWGEGGEELFSREVSAWQLQRRLQRKVLKLENGLSSQVPFEDVEREVQVRRYCKTSEFMDGGFFLDKD